MGNPPELAATADVLAKKQVAGAESLKLALEIPAWMSPLHDSGCEEGGWDKCRYDYGVGDGHGCGTGDMCGQGWGMGYGRHLGDGSGCDEDSFPLYTGDGIGDGHGYSQETKGDGDGRGDGRGDSFYEREWIDDPGDGSGNGNEGWAWWYQEPVEALELLLAGIFD